MNKNIYIIPTTKASQLFHYNERPDKLFLDLERARIPVFTVAHKNLYVTSDADIKVGDWFIYRCYKVCKCTGLSQSKQILTDNEIAKHKDYGKPKILSSKIILTTDSELIQDNVPAVEDDFLHWFINNPSCEYVTTYDGIFGEDRICKKYIIIPKEQSVQDYSGVHMRHCYQGEYEGLCKYGEDKTCPAKPKCFDCKGNIEDAICFCNRENESNITVPATYTEEDIIQFAEWIANTKLHGYCKQLSEAKVVHKTASTEELLHVWLNQFKNKQ